VQAFRIRTDRVIAPFGEAPRDLYVADRTIAQWQELACKACGLELVECDEIEGLGKVPCIVFFDDVFFTEMALRNFVADAMNSADDIALEMASSPTTEALSPAADMKRGEEDSFVYNLFSLGSGRLFHSREELQEHCSSKLQKKRSRSINLRLPKIDDGPVEVKTEITARIVAHVTHWIHLLRLSQMSIGVIMLDHFRREPSRALRLKWKRRFGMKRRHLRNFVHPSASVHPSAHLDTVVVGPNCSIGPHAHVHHSVLGAGVSIGDHARVMGCTLADKVQVLRASYIAHCASMPGASLSSYKVQLSLFGKDVFLTSSAKLLDAKLRGEIRIEHQGKIIPVGSSFLGSCLGHRVVLGADTSVQCGRAIPNGLTIVASPEKVVTELRDFKEGSLLTIRDGELTQIGAIGTSSSPEE